MSDQDNNNNLMWFLAGLGFGALLGVLYAPRSGRETRDAIRSTALEGRDYIKTRGKDAKDTVNQWVERGKEVVNRQKDQFSSAFEAGRQAFREASGEGPTNPKS